MVFLNVVSASPPSISGFNFQSFCPNSFVLLLSLLNMDISSVYGRQPSSALPSIDTLSAPPPTSRDLDHLQYHISLQDIGKRLQDAANAAYPHGQKSRYSNVYVLLLCWEDEDPKLPVTIEAEELNGVFEDLYDFDVETWKIPSQSSHNRLNRKVLDFVSLGGDRKEDLKIVYYGGHGMLAHNRQASWARYLTWFPLVYAQQGTLSVLIILALVG